MGQEWNHDVYKWLLAAVLAAGTAGAPVSTGYAAGESGLSQGSISHSGAILAFNDLNQLPANQVQGINEAVQKGMLSGYPDGSFQPQMNMTRMEFALVLAKALHLAPVADGTSFSDVPNNWASGYIEAVKRAGLMNGDANGKFNPKAWMNREQLATIFVRAIGASDVSSTSLLSMANQGDVSSWADSAVKTAVTLGLLPSGDNGFNSSQPVNRGDVAQLMVNLLQSEQRSASITAVDGDLVTVDGKTYMIGKQLKELFQTDNLNALIGSDITFESLNHSLANLSAIDLKASGTEQAPLVFDAGTAFSGDLTLSGDHIRVQGSQLNQIQVQQDVTRVDLQANTKQLIINTDQRLQITGTSKVEQIQVTSPNARINMDQRIVPDAIKLPVGVTDKQVIFGNPTLAAVPNAGGSSTTPSNNSSNRADDKKSNQAPVVTHPLLDRSVMLGEDESDIELDGLFHDEDGDELTYGTVSSDVYVADAMIRHSRLIIHPNAAGHTRISVTAQDAKGKMAETSFTYTVVASTYQEEPNRNPLVLYTPSDLNLLAGNSSDPLSLSSLFSDPDGDSLSYTYTIDDTNVVSASMTEDQLVLSGQHAGTAQVTINASDGRGGTAYVRFHVQVQPIIQLNRKPEVIRQMDNLTLSATPDVYSINLSELFRDPDGDPLVYDALVTMPYMQATIEGDKLNLMPISEGELTVILRAFDPQGTYATQIFKVKLTAPKSNHVPYIQQTLAPFSIGLLDQPFTIDLATLFGDEDNDVLSYTATSSDSSVMQTSMNGSILTATPVGAGETTLNLTVNDGQGGTNVQSVNVSVVKNGPFISELVWKDAQNQAIELYNPTTTPIHYSDLVLNISTSQMNRTFILNDAQAVIQSKSTLVVQENTGNDLLSQGDVYYGDLELSDVEEPVTLKLYYKNQLMDIATFSSDQMLRRQARTAGNPTGFTTSEWTITSGADDTDLGVYEPAQP